MKIKESIELIKNGGTLLYPSDTIWGLGCDATNETACQKLLSIKNRPAQKSFIILVDGFAMLERYVPEFHEVCYDLADLTEKPLTIIYPNVKGIAPTVLAEDGSVGIRITKDPNCLQLIKGIRKPIVSTSANLSGEPHPQNFDEISCLVKEHVDGILEERLSEKMVTPSQLIKIEIDGSFKILRK